MLSDGEKKLIRELAEKSGLAEAQPFNVDQFSSFISDIRRIDFSLVDFRRLPLAWNSWIDYNFGASFDQSIATMLRIKIYLVTQDVSTFYLSDGTAIKFFFE